MLSLSVPTCFPVIEPVNEVSELCFIQVSQSSKSIGCDIFGNLFFTDNPLGWEVWRITSSIGEDGQGFVLLSSWTHANTVLGSSPDGQVYTTKMYGDSEKWLIEKHSDRGVWIRSVAHNRLLSISSEHRLITTEAEKENGCWWNIEAANYRSGFFITSKASPKDRISCQKNGAVGTSRNQGAWEIWNVEFLEPGYVIFKSFAHSKHGQFLVCCKEGRIVVSNSFQEATHWLVEESTHGGISFRHGTRYLSFADGRVSVKDLMDASPEESETFSLHPKMPITISGPGIYTLAGVGLFGIVSAAVAPFAVMGVIGAIGFESAGIAAGSMAAGMMSAEAIASGGMIAAGGTVATLQSIGAVGLGAGYTVAAVTGGMVLGGGTAASLAAGTSAILSRNNKGSIQSEMKIHQYFAGWKFWKTEGQ